MRSSSASIPSALRSLAFLVFQLIVTPCYAAAMLLMAWSPRLWTYAMARSWCGINLWGARVLCGIRWQVQGLENIPADTMAAPSDGPVATARAPMPPHWATICMRRSGG